MVTRYVGRCGVCEGDYKLRDTRLVHHGYRRPGHGFIVGDCFGVGYVAYELSTSACAAYSESCESAQGGLRDYLERLNAGEVRELTVYKTVREGWGQRREVPEVLHADAADRGERDRFDRELDRAKAQTRSRIEFFAQEIRRMAQLVDAWERRPLRTVEEFEQVSVAAEERRARAAEREEKRRAKDEKRAARDTKTAGWEAERQALMDKYRSLFVRAALESPPNRHTAVADWKEMHRAKGRKGYLDFYPKELGVDDALITLGLARLAQRHSGIGYTEYASAYGGGLTPNGDLSPNGGYYVWVVQADGSPLLEGPYGPHERSAAESLARIGATKGAHNRVVTRSKHPDHAGFKPVAEYEAGTGRKTEF